MRKRSSRAQRVKRGVIVLVKRSRRTGKGRSNNIIKKPIILAAVEPKGHSMHKNSGIVLYWLVLLSLVILNILMVLTIPILQIAINGQKILFVVAMLGFFFGYVTHRLVNLIENLEVKHHFFARLMVPAAAMSNLFIISIATNSIVAYIGIGYKHDPVLVSLTYGIAFVIPSVVSGAATAGAFLAGHSSTKG